MAEIPLESVTRPVRGAAREAAPWVERLARVGYVARGVVYALVGVAALRVALGDRGRVEGTRGAMSEVVRQPFGRAMLVVMAAGLAGFAVWRFAQAALDPERKGTDAKGISTRAMYAVSGAVHVALALAALRLLRGGSGGSDSQARTAATVMEQPLGRWALAAAGVVVIGTGLHALYRAVKADLGKRLDLSRLSPHARKGIEHAARAGLAARGIVFGLVGWFLLRAALAERAGEARGIPG
ncbi:MAG TPA: DUF1206 domain-containing protein, partial [Longimicrobium sp.]|nr:DUF1206 domain-containing protein [Longimicrobium sp.]